MNIFGQFICLALFYGVGSTQFLNGIGSTLLNLPGLQFLGLITNNVSHDGLARQSPGQVLYFSKQEDIDSPKGTNFNNITWTLTTNSFNPNHYQTAPYVSNGYFGQTLPSEGVGYWIERNFSAPEGSWELNGWPLDQPRATFGTIAGFWNLQEKVTYPSLPENILRGGESVISGIPDWTGLVITTQEGHSYRPGVDKSTVLTYSQSTSLQNGIVHTNVTWKPDGEETIFQLNFTVIAHRTRVNLGLVRLDLAVSKAAKFIITDIIDGAGATRAHFGDKEIRATDDLMWTSVKPWGIENTTAYLASTVNFAGLSEDGLYKLLETRQDGSDHPWVSKNLSTIAQSWECSASGQQRFSVFKYVGISSSDAFPKNTQSTAFNAALQAKKSTWEQLVKEHADAWDATWEDADVQIPGDEELQIMTRGSLFHLMANSRPGTEPHGLGDNSIMVSGLSSDSYAGLIFWDSDVWMYPALLSLFPDHAMSINNYRTRLLGQAIENAQSYNYSGATFPWTSGRFGNCTATGLCVNYQIHLDTDIALSHWHYYLHTKDKEWLREKGWPIIGNVADMFANYVVRNTRSKKYETKLLGEPDEFAYNIDNGAYTNAGIKMLLGEWAPSAARVLGISTPSNWSEIAENMKIPFNEKEQMIIGFDGMDGTWTVKQASVTLITYPLGWNMNERQAQNDMTYYSAKNSPDGPAMTWSMFAINEAQLQEQGCAAYTYLQRGSYPYIREPFFQLSEQVSDDWHANQGTHPAFPFLTGYGGYLQVLTHGFTGFRAQEDAFFMDPMMVPQIPEGIKIKGLKYQGGVFDIEIGLENSTITRKHSSGASGLGTLSPIIVRIGGKAYKRGDYPLAIGESLTLQTRRPDLNGTIIAGNLAQCRPISSEDKWVPGSIPQAAVDGSNATTWQPLTPQLASLTIDLGSICRVSGVSINWGPTPPNAFTISGRNNSECEFAEIFMTEDIAISEPYLGPEEAKIVRIRPGNSTMYLFGEIHQARFVRLSIEGTQGDDKSTGATVAEVAIL